MKRLTSIVALAVSVGACSPAMPGAIDEPALTVSHGCGFGFAVGSEDETVGLVLTFLDFEAAVKGDIGAEYQLPGAAWDADLTMGRDLFSNWCDDVIEPGEPEVVIEKAFSVWGSLVIDELPEAGTCGPASGTLFGASYLNDVDRKIELGDIALTNEFWGCFAG